MARCVGGGLVLGCLFFANVLVGTEKSAPQETGGCPEANTQVELNACFAEEYKKADQELNRVYQEVLGKYRADAVFIKKLREAQRAWIQYRDAQFEARFPQILNSRGRYNYGSSFPMCSNLYKAELTRSRIQELRIWLDGIEEGDACSGSLPDEEPDQGADSRKHDRLPHSVF